MLRLEQNARIIALLDVDSFAVQIYLQENPEYRGRPCAVVQRGSNSRILNEIDRIVSVSYEAKEFGVSRNIRSDEAQERCPHIHLFEMPQKYGKPYMLKEIQASEKIHDCILDFVTESGYDIVVEKASFDEFYLDLTDVSNDQQMQYSYRYLRKIKAKVEAGSEQLLLCDIENMKSSPYTYCADLVNKLRIQIQRKTGFKTSAGLSFNKLIAKTACNLNKPNSITILNTKSGIRRVFQDLNLEKLHGLGGNLGDDVKEKLDIEKVGELRNFSQDELTSEFGDEDGEYLWRVARGIDNSPVIRKRMSNKVSTGRIYPSGMIDDDEREENIELECKCLVEKLGHDKRRNNRIANHLRAEFYLTRDGFRPDVVVTVDISNKNYDWQVFYDNIANIAFRKIDRLRYRSRKIFETKFIASDFEML